MSTARQALGRWGEQQAAEYLRQRGYQIVGHNLTTAYGEIDLLVEQAEVLVFVEVKTRRSAAFGAPETAITPGKQSHMLHSAEAYLQTLPEFEGDWRIDVIAIQQLSNGTAEITHFENAVPG